ncbi:AMPE aminopeptidase, partial [Atractosteus spatula]|nr:AMPE aminopeptidase [Atractosteus spatula]
MQNMECDGERKKRYCMRGKHVAIICGVVAVAALALGLGLGLSRPETCKAPEEIPSTPKPTTTSPPEPPPVERGPCQPSNNSNGEWKNFRLPDYITPRHYDLHLEPNLDTDIYTGRVIISLQLKTDTKYLWLHIRETFVSAPPKLQKKSGDSVHDVALVQCFEYKPQEYVVIEAKEMLSHTAKNEEYLLTLDFQGWLNGSLVGFYKTTYMEKGNLKKIAATDHEPTDARKSFPCFDEPNKKATYKISITHDSSYKALSNMPEESTTPLQNGLTKTTFQESVPMSTYLVCFAVHQFDYVEKISAQGVPLRIYVQPEQRHTAEYAANVTKEIFDYFENYFNMNYSLPKLDKIAIPDFGTGAMENWGLITYRETNLLYDQNESSSYNKQRVASVISHELVHQWFGNIVTMNWWDDLWLNEGFASFFEYIGVNKAEPDWQMRDIMLIDDVLPVMVDDALLSSHPIIVDVSSPAEITSVFDGISYSKGASILRMLEDWMGPDKFQEGCQKYLQTYHFQNAKTTDFWRSLAEVSGKPIEEVMDTWTKQMGYPVLHVAQSSRLSQKRFLLDPQADPTKPPSALNYTWTIPIQWYALGGQKNGTGLYNRTLTTEFVLEDYDHAADGLLKINRDHLGFYRVNYEIQQWINITQQLQTDHLVFSAADRVGYIDDVFSLGRRNVPQHTKKWTNNFEHKKQGGCCLTLLNNCALLLKATHKHYLRHTLKSTDNNAELHCEYLTKCCIISYISNRADLLDYGIAFNLTKYLTAEMDYLVWDRVATSISYVRDMLKDDKTIYAYFRQQVRNISSQDGWEDTGTQLKRLRRETVLGIACQMGDEGALDQATVLFNKWLEGQSIPVNLRLLVYRYGMKNSGNETSWNYMFQKYIETPLAQEKDKLLYGLASVENISLLEKFLKAIRNESVVRSQDVFTIIRYISYNKYGKTMAWDWTTLNWEYLVNRFTINDRNLGRLITRISNTFNTELQLWQMQHFFEKYPNAGAGATPRKQALETVRNNIEWIKENRDEIYTWLNNNVL